MGWVMMLHAPLLHGVTRLYLTPARNRVMIVLAKRVALHPIAGAVAIMFLLPDGRSVFQLFDDVTRNLISLGPMPRRHQKRDADVTDAKTARPMNYRDVHILAPGGLSFVTKLAKGLLGQWSKGVVFNSSDLSSQIDIPHDSEEADLSAMMGSAVTKQKGPRIDGLVGDTDLNRIGHSWRSFFFQTL